MNGVIIVTVKEILPLYKNEEVATKVELLQFEEVGYSVVSEKDMYEVGDKAIFFMPDYCVSDIALFQDFIAPNGNKSKSYLGKIEGQPRRIRAKKFNLHKGDGMPVYSNGILLPLCQISNEIGCEPEEIIDIFALQPEHIANTLGITKYEEPEVINSNGTSQARKGGFPSGVYKTDEVDIETMWNHIENMGYPINLIGTEKVDGSSINIGIIDEYPDGFITSRSVNLAFEYNKFKGIREKTIFERLMFWKKYDLRVFEIVPSDSVFVIQGKPYLNIMQVLDLKNIILRGELSGGNCKGSGNSNNPASKQPVNIKFFGADNYVNGVAVKMSDVEFNEICNMLLLPRVTELFRNNFKSKEHIQKACENYFIQRKKKTGEIIEGIVLKTPDSKFSVKYMNNEYDSKK